MPSVECRVFEWNSNELGSELQKMDDDDDDEDGVFRHFIQSRLH